MIQVENLTRRYGDFIAVDDVSFEICLLYTSDAADED